MGLKTLASRSGEVTGLKFAALSHTSCAVQSLSLDAAAI